MLRQACYGAGLLAKAKPLAGGGSALSEVPVRYIRKDKIAYPEITYLPFDWKKPAKKKRVDMAGDRTDDIGRSNEIMHRPKLAFAKLPEMETAPDEIKKIFSMGFGSNKEINRSLLDNFVNRVRQYPYDTESVEYKIAKATFVLRSLKVLVKDAPRRSVRIKITLNETIDRRNKLLKRLGRWHTKRYEFVKEMLEIDHTPAPLGRTDPIVYRTKELRRLTDEHADKMKKEKMLAYHEKLKLAQKDFEIEKREAEEWIAKEIAELKLTEDEVKSLEYDGQVLENPSAAAKTNML